VLRAEGRNSFDELVMKYSTILVPEVQKGGRSWRPLRANRPEQADFLARILCQYVVHGVSGGSGPGQRPRQSSDRTWYTTSSRS